MSTPISNERVAIIGAGPCGLAIARQLRHRHEIDAVVLDRATAPASSWRARYDGFRLNTCGLWSHLPGQRIPLKYGRWPARDDMIAYFDAYVRQQNLRVQLGVAVAKVEKNGSTWRVAADGRSYDADAVIIATGNYRQAWMPAWGGVDTFTGRLVHSVEYRNAWPYQSEDVLIVGAGNSAADIAVQLSDNVANRVRLSIRTPPHLIRRSTAGLPADAFALLTSHAPIGVVDRFAAGLRRLQFGDLTSQGLPVPPRGIYTTVQETGRIPTLAEELVDRICDGRVEVVPAVTAFDRDQVTLANGEKITPETVIAATGFRKGLEDMVGHLGVLSPNGCPLVNGAESALTGLWFAGYAEPFTGPLRSFRLQADPIATAVTHHLATAT